MIITKHNCYKILFQMQEDGMDVHKELKSLLNSDQIPLIIIKKLKDENDPVISFYLHLNNKAHKIIKEILNCDGKPVANYIKIATSIITQSIISIEHQFTDNINDQNVFIKNLGIEQLSKGLYDYFSTSDPTNLIISVQNCKNDLQAILNV